MLNSMLVLSPVTHGRLVPVRTWVDSTITLKSQNSWGGSSIEKGIARKYEPTLVSQKKSG